MVLSTVFMSSRKEVAEMHVMMDAHDDKVHVNK